MKFSRIKTKVILFYVLFFGVSVLPCFSQSDDDQKSVFVSQKNIPKKDLERVIAYVDKYEQYKAKQMVKYGLRFYHSPYLGSHLDSYLSKYFDTLSNQGYDKMRVMKSFKIKSIELEKNASLDDQGDRADEYTVVVYRDLVGEIVDGHFVKKTSETKMHINKEEYDKDIHQKDYPALLRNGHYCLLLVSDTKQGLGVDGDSDINGQYFCIFEKDIPEYLSRFKN